MDIKHLSKTGNRFYAMH